MNWNTQSINNYTFTNESLRKWNTTIHIAVASMLRQSLYMIYLIYMLIEEEETSMGLAVWVFQIYINENIYETRRLNKKLIHLIDQYSQSLNIHFLPWLDLIQLPFCSIKMPRKKVPKLFHAALCFSFLIHEKQLKVSSMPSHVSCCVAPWTVSLCES